MNKYVEIYGDDIYNLKQLSKELHKIVFSDSYRYNSPETYNIFAEGLYSIIEIIKSYEGTVE